MRLGRSRKFKFRCTLPIISVGFSILEVLDKGKAAAVTSIVETKDKASGKVIFENQSTVFIRGAGGFGGKRNGKGGFLFSMIYEISADKQACRSRGCQCGKQPSATQT